MRVIRSDGLSGLGQVDLELLNARRAAANFGGIGLTIGSFDAFHLGHQDLFQTLQTEVESRFPGLLTMRVMMSFWPHPRSVLSGLKPPSWRGAGSSQTHLPLFSLGDRIALADRYGFDHLYFVRFTKLFSALPPEIFLEKFVFDQIRPAIVVVGEDWGFGKDRQGGQRLLEEFGQRFGAKIVFVPARQIEGQKIGTSQIKLALESGDLSKVRSMLGRAFEISGSVRHGDHRGRKIGFPTANVHLTPRTLPPFGVYAVWASCEGKRYPGVANLGLRPTISPGAFVPRFEVHLLDGANHELYGKRLQVEFVTFIREERRFEGLEQLRVAIAADCQQALVELQQGIAV